VILVVRRRGGYSPDRIQSGMEDAFRNVMMSGRPVHARLENGTAPVWRPPIEVYETAEELVVLAEIAGIDEEQISVSIDDSTLLIRGERRPLCEDTRRSIHEMSIHYGPFAADVYLPFPIDHERIVASYERGLLRIELPRHAPTRIPIGGDTR